MVDLDKMSSAELEKLISAAQKRIKVVRDQEVEEGRREVAAIASRLGISVDELIDSKARGPQRRVSKPVEVKFRDPSDRSRTWTGRGRQPGWVKDWQAKHGSLDGLKG